MQIEVQVKKRDPIHTTCFMKKKRKPIIITYVNIIQVNG